MVAPLRLITENWKLKVLAFALAVLLWVVVTADQPTTGWFPVPLEIVVTDPNYQLRSDDLPAEVEVRFAGPGRDLLDIALRRPTLRLAINDVEDEVEARALEPRMVQLPGQMAVNALDVRPAAVQLQFTRVETKTVPIRATISSELGDDYAIVDTLEANPGTVRLTGPVGQLQSITSVATEAFTLTPEDSVVNELVAIDTTELAGIQLSAREIAITGRIDRVVERSLVGVPVDVGPGIGILPRAVDVTLTGPASVVEEISPEFFRVVISIAEIPTRIPSGGVIVPLRIDGLRPGVEAVLEPDRVRLFPQGEGTDTLISPQQLPGQGSSIITTPARIQ